jgi:hypothetical protein
MKIYEEEKAQLYHSWPWHRVCERERERVISVTCLPLYSEEKSSWCPLERRLDGPQNQLGYCGLTKYVAEHHSRAHQLCSHLIVFPTVYRTWRFTTIFKRALHLALSWAIPIQSTPPNPISASCILWLMEKCTPRRNQTPAVEPVAHC